MYNITVLDGQTIFDVAVQHTGNVANAAKIAQANNISVNDDLVTGAVLTIPDGVEVDDKTSRYFETSRTKPTTGDVGDQVPSGIDFMGIEIDFIVQ